MSNFVEDLSDQSTSADPVITCSIDDLTAYIQQETDALMGKPRQPGWISVPEYAEQVNINPKAACHILESLANAGKLEMSRVCDPQTHRKIKVYRRKA